MIKLDIRKFYPSSDGRRVYDFFQKYLRCSEDVAAIMFRLCTIRNTRNASKPHLPTGGASSPILAYYCYREMFAEMNALAVARGAIFSVMADDITVSGGNAPSLLKDFLKLISESGLSANYKKIRRWAPKHNNKLITGCILTSPGLRVPNPRKAALAQLRIELRSESDPELRAKLWQRYHGSLASMGQIEERFEIGAKCALAEWKADKAAWKAHLNASGSRKGRIRKR